MWRKAALVGSVCALAVFAVVELSPADAGTHPVLSKKVRGPRGPRGLRGPPGLARVTIVNGAKLVLAPGQFDGAPLARCPAGSVVIGTGFNGPFDVVGGFVLSYGSFVGGFFSNESLIALEGYVQAICAHVGAGISATGSSSLEPAISEYRADVARAERAATAD